MEDETEVLDWGNEDDEHFDTVVRRSDADEDAVSLGDDDEPEYYAYQRSPANDAAPASHASRDSESRGRSPRVGNFQDTRSGYSRGRHREGSSSSFRHSTMREPDSPQPQGTESYSPRRRSNSFSSHNAPARLTHALPPKPVASNVPYLTSHPSIVEATAMSNLSSTPGHEMDSPLPPDWEIRYPRNGRSGVYYYNTVTEESTWHHPSTLTPSKASQADNDADSSRQQQPAPTTSTTNSGLSYQDRHYRPGADPSAAPGANKRNETSYESSDSRYNTQVSFSSTPPRSPRRARSLSPSQMESVPPPPRGGDNNDSHPSRGTHRPSRGRPGVTNHDSSTQRDRDVQNDTDNDRERSSREHRWRPAPQEEGKDYKEDRERGPLRRQHRQQYPDGSPFQESPEDRDRARPSVRRGGGYTRGRDRDPPRMMEPREFSRSQNQNLSMPTSRRRSPPPRLRDTDSGYDGSQPRPRELRNDVPPSGGTGGPRGSSMSRKGRLSRYDQSTPVDDAHPHTSTIPLGDASFPQPHDAEVDEPSYPHRPVDRDHDRSSRDSHDATDGPTATQQGGVVRADTYVNRSRDDYEEDTNMHPPSGRARMSPVDDRGGPSRRKRVPLPPQESSFEESRKPTQGSGYREGHRMSPSRHARRPSSIGAPDSGTPDLPSGPRIRPPPLDTSFDRGGNPLPGPLSASYDRGRRSKWNDRRVSTNYEPTSPADAAMDVDREQALHSGSRYPPSPSVRNPEMRNASGTYSSEAADAPRAPRAMNKPYAGPGPSGPPEYGLGSGRPRERSPPPHLSGGRDEMRHIDRVDTRREYDGGRPGGGHVWRERGYAPLPDRGGPPFGREPRGRPPIPKPTTGTNDIPVGMRRRGGSAEPLRNHSPPRYGPKYYNARQPPGGGPTVIPRELPPGKESYERPPHMDIAPAPYRNNRYDNAPGRDRAMDPISSPTQTYNRRPPASQPYGPPRPRQIRKSRFERGGFEDREQPMRSWGPRDTSPPREQGNQQEPEDVGATPPPLSREPSAAATSPAWELSHTDQPPPPTEDTHSAPTHGSVMEVDTPAATEAKIEWPPRPPPPPFFGRPPPNVPMVGDSAKAKVEVSGIPAVSPVADIVPQSSPAPVQPTPSAVLTGSTDPAGEKSNASSENRRHRSRWGERKVSADADVNQKPVAEEQEPPSHFQREPDVQESYGQKNYPRRSFTFPQQSTNDEGPGNMFNPSTSYSRDRDNNRFSRYEQHQQLSDRIDTQRPELNRRGASLLDRLGDPPVDRHPQSLRDRVQVPAKRDRDEVGGDFGDRRPGRMNPNMNRRGGRRGGPP
ncbi:hypothetical protein BDQ17DRAFT_499001 [Cyathus striatus]|nr:hypothetical protein BDQ17DRAFT_499001 [Cyathus striatus]